MKKSMILFFALSGAGFTYAQHVGIGTSAPPLMKLHVAATDSALLLLENTQALGKDVSNALYFKTGNGPYSYTGAIKTIGQSSNTARLGFFTFTESSPNKLIERLSIADDGNVGIGTTTPNAKLHLVGALKMVDGTQGAGKVLTSDATGLAKWTNPAEIAAPAAFFFATDYSIGNFSFLGLGTNSSVFSRNSLVVPVNCTLTSITISIREIFPNTMISATVWKQSPGSMNPVATPLAVTILDGWFTITATSLGDIPVMQGDLISIKLSWDSGGSLINGATVAVTYR